MSVKAMVEPAGGLEADGAKAVAGEEREETGVGRKTKGEVGASVRDLVRQAMDEGGHHGPGRSCRR